VTTNTRSRGKLFFMPRLLFGILITAGLILLSGCLGRSTEPVYIKDKRPGRMTKDAPVPGKGSGPKQGEKKKNGGGSCVPKDNKRLFTCLKLSANGSAQVPRAEIEPMTRPIN